ncbi:MAG: hypothetical protein J7L39_03835 [Candidatus Aenigmarchaeota archaeon]|nr:hypothetical protein [Candidatus Aenigmarchaeota archaeon]
MRFIKIREWATVLALFVSIFVLSGARVVDGACYIGYCDSSYFIGYGCVMLWVSITIAYILFNYQKRTALILLSVYLFLVVFIPSVLNNEIKGLISATTIFWTPGLLIYERTFTNPLEKDVARYKYEEEFGR